MWRNFSFLHLPESKARNLKASIFYISFRASFNSLRGGLISLKLPSRPLWLIVGKDPLGCPFVSNLTPEKDLFLSLVLHKVTHFWWQLLPLVISVFFLQLEALSLTYDGNFDDTMLKSVAKLTQLLDLTLYRLSQMPILKKCLMSFVWPSKRFWEGCNSFCFFSSKNNSYMSFWITQVLSK